jgi:2-polyprenyl-3-methyl-5-hydroxy-6-metoxy-1,4-benzoquinol methylase
MIAACPICGSVSADTVFHIEDFPVRLFVDRQGAAEDTAPLTLVRCRGCAHLYNQNFSDALAERMYGDVPLTNVPAHPSMVKRLEDAIAWIDPEHYAGRRVVEIGGGAGHVARLLSGSAAEVVVFEPCRALTSAHLPEPNIRLVSDIFRGPVPGGPADLMVCRQVIEHVADPFALISAIRDGLTPGGHAYLEVPDARFIDRGAAFGDIVLQHVQYFTLETFTALARRAGLESMRTLAIKGGHDFGVLFRAAERPATWQAPDAGIAPADDLSARLTAAVIQGAEQLSSIPGTMALYGATAQGQAFLTHHSAARRFVRVYDDNPALAGRRLAGGGQTPVIVRPDAESLRDVDAVLICAYLHDEVIAERLRALGFQGTILSARPGFPPPLHCRSQTG